MSNDKEKEPSVYAFGDRARMPILLLCAFIIGVFIAGQIASSMEKYEKKPVPVDPAAFEALDKFNDMEAKREAAEVAQKLQQKTDS